MIRIVIFILVLLVCNSTMAVPDGAVGSVFQPNYKTKEGEKRAGTLFVMQVGEVKYALTAHHIFGKSGGFKKEYSGKSVCKLVKKIEFMKLDGTKKSPIKTKCVPIVDANEYGYVSGGKKDLAVFKLKSEIDAALTPSKFPAKAGDVVWVLANLGGQGYMHKAKVNSVSDNWVDYIFEDKSLNLRGSSGAPVVNSAGEVIGINLGAEGSKSNLIGVGSPVSTIVTKLK